MGKAFLSVILIQLDLMLLFFPNSISKLGNAQLQHKINVPLEKTPNTSA